MKTLRPLSLVLMLACTFALSSCSTSFNRAWDTAIAKPGHAGTVEGPWIGTWLSHDNGHHGELRCVVGPDTKGDRTFLYHAVWGGVLSGHFESVHHVKVKGSTATFTADSHLGIYGQFHAEGTIKGGQFKATYKAAGDHGVFEMKRP